MTEQPTFAKYLRFIPRKGKLTVESYEFEPIKGYPMLNWKGKTTFYLYTFLSSSTEEKFMENLLMVGEIRFTGVIIFR